MRTLREALIEDENVIKFLIDGFPRSFQQAEEFQSEVCNKNNFRKRIYLEISIAIKM